MVTFQLAAETLPLVPTPTLAPPAEATPEKPLGVKLSLIKTGVQVGAVQVAGIVSEITSPAPFPAITSPPTTWNHPTEGGGAETATVVVAVQVAPSETILPVADSVTEPADSPSTSAEYMLPVRVVSV